MWSFILGLILGLAAKTVYDLFKDEQLPTPMGLNAGRIEGLLDETRQTVRDLREEVRQALVGQGSFQEKATHALSAVGETVAGARSGQGEGTAADSGAQSGEERLKLTSSEGDSSVSEPSAESAARVRTDGGGDEGRQNDGGTAPAATHGTIQTMS